jgi:hypothetical protein
MLNFIIKFLGKGIKQDIVLVEDIDKERARIIINAAYSNSEELPAYLSVVGFRPFDSTFNYEEYELGLINDYIAYEIKKAIEYGNTYYKINLAFVDTSGYVKINFLNGTIQNDMEAVNQYIERLKEIFSFCSNQDENKIKLASILKIKRENGYGDYDVQFKGLVW